MLTVSVSELKAQLSAFLEIVRSGDEVLVTDRGRPVARLVPVRGAAEAASRHDDLVRSGRLREPSAPLASDFWTRKRPVDPTGRSLAAVLEERAEGR